ncbi:hypothetical protein [Microbacterium sp.]|uniref:hypothetical protein n=1 Tax=Microbacterium sp. TaxID=51671 RepID=UPI002811596C|nr:hypothetical protein [Microbacterium sp.]
MFDFIVFLVLFVGGIVLFGIAHELPAAQGLVFTAGIIAVSLSLAWVMRQAGSATRRVDSWNRRQE